MTDEQKSFEQDHSSELTYSKFKAIASGTIGSLLCLCGIVFGFYEFMKNETQQQHDNQKTLILHESKFVITEIELEHLREEVADLESDKATKHDLNKHIENYERENDKIWQMLNK